MYGEDRFEVAGHVLYNEDLVDELIEEAGQQMEVEEMDLDEGQHYETAIFKESVDKKDRETLLQEYLGE